MFVGRMRAFAVLSVFVAVFAPAVQPAVAVTGNPHNLGSCSSCHKITPRFGVDTRHDVTFTTSPDDPGLCAPCHQPGTHPHPVLVDAGSGPPGARASAYLPAGTTAAFSGKIVCTTCHFIHSADTRNGLLRGFPGSPDPRNFGSVAAFCEECHGNNLVARSGHGGGEKACVFCHAGQPRPQWQAEASESFRERCEVCHRTVVEAHYVKLNPFDKRLGCLGCHDRHAVVSASPGLLTDDYRTAAADRVTISPHYRHGLCFFCHTNTDDYALREEDPNVLCDRCHASGKIRPNIHPLRKVPTGFKIPKGWPLADGALYCLTCHEQGHDDQERRVYMLRGGPYASPRAVCGNCHSMVDLATSKLHQDINAGNACEMCHKTRPQLGVDSIKTVTFIADPDLLCLRCHDQSATDGSVHHGGVVGREIEDGHIPRELPLYKGRVICATCHNPHMRDATGARLREYIESSNFCVSCHRD